MRKRICIAVFALFTSAMCMAQAPALKIIYPGGTKALNDSTLTLYGSTSTSQLAAVFFVINQGSSTLTTVKAMRQPTSTVAGSTNSFCWDLCYPPTTNKSTGSISMAPQDTVKLFSGDYNPSGNVGTTTIKYIFFDAVTHDSAWVIVNFNITPASVAQITSNPLSISAPYPNPANNNVSFSYHSNANDRLILYNSLGQMVEEMPLNSNQDKVAVNVEGITSGIYICKLESAGAEPVYQRLIVSH